MLTRWMCGLEPAPAEMDRIKVIKYKRISHVLTPECRGLLQALIGVLRKAGFTELELTSRVSERASGAIVVSVSVGSVSSVR